MKVGSRGIALSRSCTSLAKPSFRPTPSVCSNREYRSTEASHSPQPATANLSSRWLSDVKQRLGKCLTFGLQPEQTQEAGRILQEIAHDWRALVAGSEGFLTSPKRQGLYRHRVVWGEQDAMGHVNNVMYNRYAESGRIEWVQKYARYIDPTHAQEWVDLVSPKGDGLILRKITTDFKFPMRYPDHISVYHKLGMEPTPTTDAFAFDVVIISELHQRIAARVTEDCAMYDYRVGKKTTLKPFMVDVLRETWRLQEQAKQVNSERVRALLDRVRKLEIESWDREGAKENMGNANR